MFWLRNKEGELSGRVLDLRLKGRGIEPQPHHCVVSLSKTQLSLLRKTRLDITERLLTGT